MQDIHATAMKFQEFAKAAGALSLMNKKKK